MVIPSPARKRRKNHPPSRGGGQTSLVGLKMQLDANTEMSNKLLIVTIKLE